MASNEEKRKRKAADFWPMLLTPVDGECELQQIHVDKKSFEIGSGVENDSVILHKSIARKHCVLKIGSKGKWELQQSTFGVTKVNGLDLLVGRPRELEVGDKVQLGTGFEFLYSFEAAVNSGMGALKKQRFSDAVYIPIKFGSDVKRTLVRVKIEPPDRRSILEAKEENKENEEDDAQQAQISMSKVKVESGVAARQALEEDNRLLRDTLNARMQEFEASLNAQKRELEEKLNAKNQEFEAQLKKVNAEKRELDENLNAKKREFAARLKKLIAQKQACEAQMKETLMMRDQEYSMQLSDLKASRARDISNSNLMVANAIYSTMYDCVRCAICYNLFITAVTLECGHTFCSFCIKDWCNTVTNCPTCRMKITAMSRTLVLDNVIAMLLQNVDVNYANHRMALTEERRRLEANGNQGVMPMATQGHWTERKWHRGGQERNRSWGRWKALEGPYRNYR